MNQNPNSREKINIDVWCANIFNYKSTDEFFKVNKEKKELRKNELLDNNMIGSQGPCIKCGSLKTTIIMKQTRSADEPITMKKICGSCGTQENKN